MNVMSPNHKADDQGQLTSSTFTFNNRVWQAAAAYGSLSARLVGRRTPRRPSHNSQGFRPLQTLSDCDRKYKNAETAPRRRCLAHTTLTHTFFLRISAVSKLSKRTWQQINGLCGEYGTATQSKQSTEQLPAGSMCRPSGLHLLIPSPDCATPPPSTTTT